MTTNRMKTGMILMAVFAIFTACNPTGKKAETYDIPLQNNTGQSAEISKGNQESSIRQSDEIHKVVAKEVLNSKKYVYVKVDENGEEFWIASPKTPVSVGEIYYFKNGVLKTNYESKEFNRLFEEIYLVPAIVPANHSMGSNPGMAGNPTNTKESLSGVERKSAKRITKKGSLSIAELVSDPEKYQGKTVQVSGECVKINPNIMKRNWIHLKDGSKDDFDLVVTSDEFVKEGETVTFKATVTLKKDFGAGYYYDLILENGIRIE